MEPPKVALAWARRFDEARDEWVRENVDGWARAAKFSQPLNWGEAEAAVLARDYPPLPGRFVLNAVAAVSWGLFAVFSAPFFGAALVGLVLVIVAAGQEARAEGLLAGARIVFGGAIVMTCIWLGMWWETRRRSVVGVAMAGVTVIGSAVTYALLLVLELPEVPWLSALVLVAAALGLTNLVLEMTSRPEGRAKSRKPPQRGPRGSDKRIRAGLARDRLLEVLIHRGLVDVDEADRIRIREMPLGYWSELDGLNAQEWRRVLEYRHVGWREFGPGDKRVH